MKTYKALMIILDGCGDRKIPSLAGRTPLEVARTPNLDSLAEKGMCGLMYVIAPGIPPGSDTAHLALFGYDPYETYTGRGAFEALGANIELSPHDVAFRANFATVDENWKIIDRRAGRTLTDEEGRELAEAVNSELKKVFGDKVFLVHTVEHRGVLVIRGPGVSRHVSNTDPHEIGVRVEKCVPLDDSPEAKRTAEIVNKFTEISYKVLKDHPVNKRRVKEGKLPANIVLVRGAGTLPRIEPIGKVYGLKAACIAGVALIKGVAKAVGMDVYTAPGLRGTAQDTYDAAFDLARELLFEKGYDLVVLHVKGTDAASHDFNPELKIKVIEEVDKALGKFLEKVDLSQLYIVVTADHATPCMIGDHRGDPVPLLFYGPDIVPDSAKRFCERECAEKGALKGLRGRDLIPMIANYINKCKKFGE